jgi:thioredoxin-like negative regulator of GroEL
MAVEQIVQGDRKLADIIKACEDKLLMVVFYARWCKPCRRLLSLVLPTVVQQGGEGVALCLLNAEETRNYQTSRELKAQDIPAVLFFQEGKEIGRITGLAEPKALIHEINCRRKKKTGF